MRARARATQAVCSGARGTERDRERARDFSLVQPHSSNGSPFRARHQPSPHPSHPPKPDTQAKKDAKDYDESDLAFLAKKKEVRAR